MTSETKNPSAAFYPTASKFFHDLFKRQTITLGLSETGVGSIEISSSDGTEDEDAHALSILPFPSSLIQHEPAVFQRVETWNIRWLSDRSAMNIRRSTRQPRNTLERPIEENISFGTEAKQSFKLVFATAIRTASTNPAIRYILSLSLLMPFTLFVAFYAAPWISAIVVRKSLAAVFDYLQSPVCAFWEWSNSALYIAHSYSYYYIFTTLGSFFGFISPMVLPPLGDEYSTILPPIQSLPLAHVDGMVLALQVTASYVNELEYYIDVERGTSQNQLHLLDGLVVQLPSEPFESTTSTRLKTIASDNKLLGDRMSWALEAERNALHGFRRRLRKEPTASILKTPKSLVPSKNAVTGNQWFMAWQTIQTNFLRWVRPSVKNHLLRHLNRLESILKNSLAKRGEWDLNLYDSSLSKLHVLVVPVCQAAKMLSDIKWKLEAKIDELPPPAIASGDKEGAHTPAGSNKEVGLESLSNNIRVVQANYGHMCLFALEDRKVAIEIMSKVADDRKRYQRALEALTIIRSRVKFNPLTDSRSILAFEREMDNIALSMLEGIEYWEERQRAD